MKRGFERAIWWMGLLLAFATAGRGQEAAPAVLANGAVEVRFGARGMTQISDRAAGLQRDFAADNFSLLADGVAIRAENLAAPTRAATANTVTYEFRSGPYRIEVVYELKPAWRFVSKQLLVSVPAGKVMRVEQVEALALTVAEPVTGEFVPHTSFRNRDTGDYGAFLRFGDGGGMFALVQNPFLRYGRSGQSFRISYRPEMDWKQDWGAFASDRACIGLYRQTGRRLAATMTPEWKMTSGDGSRAEASGEIDRAEIDAYTECVRAFLLDRHEKSVRINVGWCENDYQIDVATEPGRAEYRRIIDSASQLGLTHVLYAASNSDVSRRQDSTDDWQWEYVLWLGLGQKIRRGEWEAKAGAVPASVQQMLDYARSRNVKLVAYVYPVLPFAQNREWLVSGSTHHSQNLNASLGDRAFQDWLIAELLAFYRRTGIGGYAFDYTFLWYPGTSPYAQWSGWRRVMESLRAQAPEIVIDGRQLYQEYGPWSWLAGSYPHPTSTDEQPESFAPFPDLHFDRVSADRERYTAYWYRNHEFAPAELVPGFIGHQTPRADAKGEMVYTRFRVRDWDYLGWRYSLLSSIAVAGLNHVVNMIPARDEQEFAHFSPADRQWFRQWLDWADKNRDLLLHTRTILGEPAIGRADGTAAIVADHGFVFLFNPNARAVTAEFALDESIGLKGGQGSFTVRQVYPEERGAIANHEGAVWRAGERVSFVLDGTSATVVEISPLREGEPARPQLFNAAGHVELARGTLRISDVRGEPGTERTLLVALPGSTKLRRATVNGVVVPFDQRGGSVSLRVRFVGQPFAHSQQVGSYDPAFAGATFTGEFTIPTRIRQQLAKRREAWPIQWTAEDLQTPWLAPERLLLFVEIAEPKPEMSVSLRIDGRDVELTKAYSSIWPNPHSFVGWYADASGIAVNQPHRLELALPTLRPGQFQGVFFDNVETEYTTQVQAAH